MQMKWEFPPVLIYWIVFRSCYFYQTSEKANTAENILKNIWFNEQSELASTAVLLFG